MRKHVIAAWSLADRPYEYGLGLVENAEHTASNNFAEGSEVHVLLLRNEHPFSDDYLGRVRDSNFIIHDLSRDYQKYEKDYAWLKQLHPNHFDMFMRWILIDDFFQGEPLNAYDADIIFSTPLSKFSKAIEDYTFNPSSTCFLSAKDRVWFEAYRKELEQMKASPEAFYEPFGGLTDNVRFVNSEERLAHLLMETGRLPYEHVGLTTPYVFIPNPKLLPSLKWFADVPNGDGMLSTPVRFCREGNIYYLNDKVIPFWHLQRDFQQFVGQTVFMRNYLEKMAGFRIPTKHPWCDSTDPHRNKNLDQKDLLIGKLLQWIQKVGVPNSMNLEENPFTYSNVYQKLFNGPAFGYVFNNHVWPTKIWDEENMKY